MKKKICFLVFVSLLILFLLKYLFSNYKITYSINGFDVLESYEDGKYYFELENDALAFNALFYTGKKINRKLLDDISVFESDNYNCLDLNFDFYAHYPICYDKNGDLLHYSLIDDEDVLLYLNDLGVIVTSDVDYEDEFYFTNSLNEDEFIAVWKYDGFYLLNNSGVKSIDIFDNDRYSNNLSYLYDNILFLPNYDEDLFFTKFILLDITDGDYKIYETDYEISYDSYISGTNGNDIYLFDRKNDCLYEINVKKGKIDCVGNSDIGYIKYENGKKVDASLREYDEDYIMYFDVDFNNMVVDGMNYYYSYDDDIVTKFINEPDFNIVYICNNDVYYLVNDNLFVFNPLYGNKLLLHYFELNFNDSNRIFVYNK